MYYLNLNKDGYLLSAYTLGEGAQPLEDIPALESLEGLDLSGVRVNAYYWDGTSLILDSDKLAELDAAEAAVADSAAAAERADEKRLAEQEAVVSLAKIMIQSAGMTDTQRVSLRVLYPTWAAGAHTAGEFYITTDGQPWECIQDYDTTIYPDIVPGGAAWGTFNRPLHGSTPDTALPFVAPTGAHDVYKPGEYATLDGTLWFCVQNTAYSPADYADAWERG